MSGHRHPGGGGMTGATGDLTPDEADDAFVPGELREIADPGSQGTMTREQAAGAPAQRGDVGNPERLPFGPPTNMATRDDGYGSRHGLRPDDPAYRMESHGIDRPAGAGRDREPADPAQIGGDELHEAEDHF